MPAPSVDLDARHAKIRPFEEAELALVRSVVNLAAWLPEADENAIRYALNLARLTVVRAPDGADVDVEAFLDPYRSELLAVIEPLLLRMGGIDKVGVGRAAPYLGALARKWKAKLAAAFGAKLPVDALDREVREKALVVVCGGGGGVGYVYLGAFALLEQFNLVPRLLAGTSMGAVLQLFRARRIHFHPEEIHEVVENLTWKTLFRYLQTESRYGLPAAMRLYLRHGIGHFLKGPEGHPLTLDQLAIPLIVAVGGIRNGALPRDPGYYEHLLDSSAAGGFSPSFLHKQVLRAAGAVIELVGQRDRFARIYLGADPETRSFDAIDAVGFSSAVPGVIHYDMLRDDERMHAMLRALFARHDLFRLVDGGVVDNLPARAAWRFVQQGHLGTRNAFVLAFDAFAPKLSQPLWFALQQIAAQTVTRNRPYVHHLKSFQRVLSPIELIPTVSHVERAVQNGKQELMPDMPLVARMNRPLPPLS